jgi:hypothetical protein
MYFIHSLSIHEYIYIFTNVPWVKEDTFLRCIATNIYKKKWLVWNKKKFVSENK